jgi:hypothetical protein
MMLQRVHVLEGVYLFFHMMLQEDLLYHQLNTAPELHDPFVKNMAGHKSSLNQFSLQCIETTVIAIATNAFPPACAADEDFS